MKRSSLWLFLVAGTGCTFDNPAFFGDESATDGSSVVTGDDPGGNEGGGIVPHDDELADDDDDESLSGGGSSVDDSTGADDTTGDDDDDNASGDDDDDDDDNASGDDDDDNSSGDDDDDDSGISDNDVYGICKLRCLPLENPECAAYEREIYDCVEECEEQSPRHTLTCFYYWEYESECASELSCEDYRQWQHDVAAAMEGEPPSSPWSCQEQHYDLVELNLDCR